MFDPTKPITPENTTAEPAVAPVKSAADGKPAAAEKKVEFSPEQQEKIDQIVKEAMGRAGRAATAEAIAQRARADALAKDLLLQSKANAPDAEESDKLRAQLATKDRELEEVRAATAKQARDTAALRAAERQGFVSAEQALRLIDVPQDADKATVEAAIKALAEANPHLIKGTTRSGSGSGVADRPAQVDFKLEQLFGPRSDARAANQLAIRDNARYKKLRAEAVRKGLLL